MNLNARTKTYVVAAPPPPNPSAEKVAGNAGETHAKAEHCPVRCEFQSVDYPSNIYKSWGRGQEILTEGLESPIAVC